MRYSSIQVTPAMRRALAAYKLRGMSYEEVLEVFTEAVTPAEFRARYAAARADAARRTVPATRSATEAAEAGRRASEERERAMTPMERMDGAYRLFRLTRGIA